LHVRSVPREDKGGPFWPILQRSERTGGDALGPIRKCAYALRVDPSRFSNSVAAAAEMFVCVCVCAGRFRLGVQWCGGAGDPGIVAPGLPSRGWQRSKTCRKLNFVPAHGVSGMLGA